MNYLTLTQFCLALEQMLPLYSTGPVDAGCWNSAVIIPATSVMIGKTVDMRKIFRFDPNIPSKYPPRYDEHIALSDVRLRYSETFVAVFSES